MSTRYTVVTPDGKRITVSGPDDATDEELVGIAQEYLASSKSRYAKGRVNVARPVASPTISPAEPTKLRPAVQSALDKRNAMAQPGEGILSQITQGATFGLSDEVAGVAGALNNLARVPFGGEFAPIRAYQDERDAERAYLGQVSEASPLSSLAGNVVGGFVGGTPRAVASAIGQAPNALAAVRAGLKEGAALGALAGFGSGDGVESSAIGAAGGGIIGGGLGALAPLAFSTVKKTYDGVSRLLGRDPSGLSSQIVGRAFAADGNAPRDVAETITSARALGVPLAPADTGENARGLLASVTRQPGPSKAVGRRFVEDRQRFQGERVRVAIGRDLGPLTNQPAQAQELRDAALAAARGTTEDAAGNLTRSVEAVGSAVDRLGSGASARETFGAAYDAARQRSRDAYGVPALQNPQPIEIPAEVFSRDFRAAADAFYGDGGGTMPAVLSSIIDDAAAPQATTRTLTNIDRRLADFAGSAKMAGNAREAAFAERIRGNLASFADRAAPAEYRSALANAKSVRAEQGRLYETRDLPRAFANDRFGNPVVGDTSIPQRLFRPGAGGGDTADSLIAAVGPEEAERLAREEVRRVLEEGGELTPQAVSNFSRRFAEAIDRFPSLRSDLDAVSSGATNLAAARTAETTVGREGSTALERGYAALNATPDELDQMAGALAAGDRDLFLQGYRNALADRVASKADGADKGRALLGSDAKRGALARLFPGDDLARFEQTLDLESQASATRALVSTGSKTAENAAADALTADNGLIEDAAGAVLRSAKSGGWGGAIAELSARLRDTSQFGAGKAGETVRENIATLLTQSDPALLREALERANRAAQAALFRDGNNLAIGTATGVGVGRGASVAAGASNGQ